MKLNRFLLSIISIICITGCISSFFKEPTPQYSNEITALAPNDNFKKLSDSIYPAWKNTKTGSVLSLISDCSDNLYSLASIHDLVGQSLDSYKVTEKKTTQFNKKYDSFYQKISGTLDKSNVEIRSYSFKYKNCLYISSLSAAPDKIESDLENFNQFNQNLVFK